MTSNATILVFSWEPWGNMWYSKQHYAAELAKTHRVFFVTPPGRWKPGDLLARRPTLKETPEKVVVVNYRNRLPLRGLPAFLRGWANRLIARQLRKLLDPGNSIIWCFHPTALVLQREMQGPGIRMIYHVVDPYQTFELDGPCAQQADLVVAVNSWFAKHYAGMNPNIMVVPHGIPGEGRSRAPGPAGPSRTAGRPYMILAGGFSRHVNYQLLAGLLASMPSVDLRLAGPLLPLPPELEPVRARLLAMPQVHYHGTLHPRELRALVQGAAVGLIAYEFQPSRTEPDGPGRTPLKALTYLAQHVPVVSTINCFIPELAATAIHKADDAQAFAQSVSAIIEKRAVMDHAAVDRYLDRIDYGTLAARILEALVGTQKEASGHDHAQALP